MDSQDGHIDNDMVAEEEDSEDIDAKGSESSEDNDDNDSDEENMTQINRLQEELSLNGYNYDKHLQLIERLGKCGELELIRKARERMSQLYPLSPNLWLQWINDEMRMASSDDEKSKVLSLFERSVTDYLSSKLWVEYVQFSIGLMASLGVDGVRKVFERALTQTGLHVSQGSLIWDAFREFESAILQTIDSEKSEELKKQIDRIFDLFRRQLSVPLKGMENTYKECEDWCKGIKESINIELKLNQIKSVYDKALQELQKLMPYEESILNSEPPHLEQYQRYIEYETINGSPMRVQCIYERALTDNCLVNDLWINYTKYQDKKVVVESILQPIYERSVRNCPWSSQLWISYLRALERVKSDHQKIINVFESALQSGFQQSNEYLQLWLTYFDYLRRNTDWKDEKQVKSLRTTFEKAIEHLSNIENADPNCCISQYWAKIEAKFCNNIEGAREMWNNLLSSRPDIGSQVQNWIEFSKLERIFGNEKEYRKILVKGLVASTDWPESIGQILIQYEREEGISLESFEQVMDKYESVVKKITRKRIVAAEKEKEERKQMKSQKKQEKYELKRAVKRKSDDKELEKDKRKDNLDSDGFKVPELLSVTPSKRHKNREKWNEGYDQKRPKRVEQPTHGVTHRSDGSKDLQTVFVSNLDFKIDESQLRETFEKFGKIDDLRLVRNYKGLSKGYAYVEFASIESVNEALKHDRMLLEGRPAFISQMGKRNKFNFSTNLEKHKLFVKNISFNMNNEDLRKLFEKYGTVKDVRLVTHRNGHSKGCAYVEYDDEVSANEAIKQADGLLVDNKNISVALSNPNVNSRQNASQTQDIPPLGSGSTPFSTSSQIETTRRTKSRINAPMIPHSLRVQRQTQNGTNSVASDQNQNNGSTPLSNSDFRSMLLSKK